MQTAQRQGSEFADAGDGIVSGVRQLLALIQPDKPTVLLFQVSWTIHQ